MFDIFFHRKYFFLNLIYPRAYLNFVNFLLTFFIINLSEKYAKKYDLGKLITKLKKKISKKENLYEIMSKKRILY